MLKPINCSEIRPNSKQDTVSKEGPPKEDLQRAGSQQRANAQQVEILRRVKKRYKRTRVISSAFVTLLMFVLLVGFTLKWCEILLGSPPSLPVFIITTLYLVMIYVCATHMFYTFCERFLAYRKYLNTYFEIAEGWIREVAPHQDGWLVQGKSEHYGDVFLYMYETHCPIKQSDHVYISLVDGIPRSIEEVVGESAKVVGESAKVVVESAEDDKDTNQTASESGINDASAGTGSISTMDNSEF